MMLRRLIAVAAATFAGVSFAGAQTPLGTAFTYQGVLKSSNAAYNGTADLRFTLYDAASAGAVAGSTLDLAAVIVIDGQFTVTLDFGAAPFNSEPPSERWLAIEVRAPAGGGAYVALTPRQRLTATPFALRALNASISGTQPNPVNFSNAANLFSGSGAALTNLSASNIASGNLAVSRMPTGGTWSVTNQTTISGQTFGSLMTISNLEDDPSNTLSVSTSTSNGAAIEATALQQAAAAIVAQNAHPNGYGINIFAARNYVGGRMGFGTFNPASAVHVQNGATGLAPSAGTGLTIESSSTQYLNMIAGDAFESGMLFGRPASGAAAAGIIYNNPGAPNGLQFRTGGNNTRLSIDATGRALLTSAQTGASMMGMVNSNDEAAGVTFTALRTWFVGQNRPADAPGIVDSFYVRDVDANATRLLINTSGQVGIGTTSPQQRLSVQGGMNIDQGDANNATVANSLRFGSGSGEAIASRRTAGPNQFGLDFYTGSAQRMTITNTGSVGIGTVGPGGFMLAVNGFTGNLTGTWSIFSDARLKTNIHDLPAGTLDKMLALRGRTFEYTPEARRSNLADEGVKTGFIAQEVRQVFPEWVAENPDGYLFITERGTTALMVEALRELRAEKDSQLAQRDVQIAELRAELAALRAEVTSLARSATPRSDIAAQAPAQQ